MTFRGWINLIRSLAITLAPAYVLALVFWYFGFRIESILASILFVQIWVLVVQAEAMLRQSAWGMAVYDAIFGVSADVRSQATIITVANSGEKPAYNFFIGLRDETTGSTLKYEPRRKTEAHTLNAGDQQAFLVRIRGKDLLERRISLHISYVNVLGHFREAQAFSLQGSEEFFMMPTPVEPGFLIRAYEDLMLFARWQFRYRKFLKK